MKPTAHPPGHLRRDTGSMSWTASGAGVWHKPILVQPGAPDAEWDIALVRLAAGASLPAPVGARHADHGQEVLVLEGRWTVPQGELDVMGYSRRPARGLGGDSTDGGCVLFVRNIAPAAPEPPAGHVRFDAGRWLPGQGNLRVRPLHSADPEGTALVHWPPRERFVPHRHWGGEEILVLSGTFRDEHGSYPAGTWLQSPHLSSHHPFVTDETVIFVKTGHLPQVRP